MQTQNQNNPNQEIKTTLIWKVVENSISEDYLTCHVFENEVFQYGIKVIKTAKNSASKVGIILKQSLVTYNYLSPDGFTISAEDFATADQAKSFIQNWIKRFERQGYYSSNSYGQIPLNILEDCCDILRNVHD